MRILGHLHTFNDEAVIDRALETLLAQTYPPDEILLVDNGSSDGTLNRSFPKQVTVIRQPENRGTTGSVTTGFQYALAKGYEWVWVLDADSVPRPDALERLVEIYSAFTSDDRAKIGVLSSRMETPFTGRVVDYAVLTPRGLRVPAFNPGSDYCDCDATIWSGTLFNMQAVHAVGLPKSTSGNLWEEFYLDWGDIEYCYRIRKGGYRVLVHRSSLMTHPIGQPIAGRFFGWLTESSNHSPFRRHLFFRNMTYFLMYRYPERNAPAMLLYIADRLIKTSVKILLMEEEPIPKLRASLRGVWDGLRKRLDTRY